MDYVIHENTLLPLYEVVIKNHRGQPLYRLAGPVLHLRDDLRFTDAQGEELAQIKQPLLSDQRMYEIFRNGARWAQVSMVGVGNLLEGFDVMVEGADPLRARGDMLSHSYAISSPAGTAAQVHHGRSGSYAVKTEPGQDDVLLLASVVAMSAMTTTWSRSAATP
jgi:uncharacterized protein YxjI